MATDVHVPIVEAAPQDAHGETQPVAAADVDKWRELGHVHKEKVGDTVVVGVVDTALQENSWFAGRVRGTPQVGNVPGLLDHNYKAGHATFVSGLVLQQAPAARVRVRGALDQDGQGLSTAVETAALDLVQGNGGPRVQVLNLSLGCYGDDPEKAEFTGLLAKLWQADPDLVVVAAAGNKRDGEHRAFYPARLADHARLVSVAAATDGSAQTLASWSNSGSWVTFMVNGTDLISTYLRFTPQAGDPPGRWARWSGTSFATGLATGIIAATMAPGDGTQRSAKEAVARLRGASAQTVSLPTEDFPPKP